MQVSIFPMVIAVILFCFWQENGQQGLYNAGGLRARVSSVKIAE